MMQSSEDPRPLLTRPLLTAEQKIELLAKLQKAPSHSKAIAKVAGISEITLHSWRTSFAAGEELLDDVPPAPATPEPPVKAVPPAAKEVAAPAQAPGRGFTYPLELRIAAAKAYLNGGKPAELARKFNITHPSSVLGWARAYEEGRLNPADDSPPPPPKEVKMSESATRRRFPDDFRYNVAKAVMAGELTAADASRKYEVHQSLVSGWIKLVKTKKLKPPRGKPGPKPKDLVTEVVEEYRAQQMPLALSSPAPVQPRAQLARVTTVHEELAKKDAEIARLKRLLLQTQAMLLDNGE